MMIFFGYNERAWTTLSKCIHDSETKASHDRDYEEFVLDFMFWLFIVCFTKDIHLHV